MRIRTAIYLFLALVLCANAISIFLANLLPIYYTYEYVAYALTLSFIFYIFGIKSLKKDPKTICIELRKR